MKNIYLLYFGLFACFNIQAAELLEPEGIAFGSGRLIPQFRMETFYDDNMNYAATDEIETLGVLYQPALGYEIKDSKRRFFAGYQLSGAHHEDSSPDNYVDRRTRLGYQYTPTSRISVGVNGEHFDSHDPRGTGAAEGSGVIQTRHDRWHHLRLGTNFAYGARTAKARLETDASFTHKHYENNRNVTAVRDRDDITASGRFYYRILPKTSLLLEGRATHHNYKRTAPNSASLDGITSQGLLGLAWRGTFKTTGTAQVGYIRKSFDASARDTGEAFSWQLGVEWRPRSYSTFNLNTRRDFLETNGAGDFIIDDSIALNWEHSWNTRIKTRLNLRYAENDFEADNTGRRDEHLAVGANVVYAFGNHLEIGAGYNYEERYSNDDRFDYEKNIGRIFATVAF